MNDTQTLGCVVIGRELNSSGNGHEYYVLVVAPLDESSEEYERVGVGYLKEEDISRKFKWVSVI